MTDRYLVEQVCGYFGLVFWSLQLAPQAYKTYRRGTSTGVSVWTMLIWTFAGVFMGVYNIGLGVAIGLWVQPQIFTFISCICVSQEFRYQHGWSKLKTFCGFVASCLFVGGLEAGLIFAFKKAQQVNNQDGIRFFGIMPVIFVVGGFLPQYYEIFLFGEEIDSLDLANYIAIACLDTGILALYYLFEWYQKKIILKETLEESQIDQASSPEDVTETMSNDSQEEKKTPSQ
ncbi:hypothetical protein INT46_009666 [Mucor plumbeus]|uniref:Uncharacterized protein n=1 Tax=Mucor plumbeus TaxID=97098 RepID=A0A8H7VFR5_9FUNG|nr:hypothetical protein INT46_009666 [Mucor plumbeus]